MKEGGPFVLVTMGDTMNLECMREKLFSKPSLNLKSKKT